MESFQASVKKLRDRVAKASSLWNDPQFSALSAAIGKITGFSKDLIVNGDKRCTSIDLPKFPRKGFEVSKYGIGIARSA